MNVQTSFPELIGLGRLAQVGPFSISVSGPLRRPQVVRIRLHCLSRPLLSSPTAVEARAPAPSLAPESAGSRCSGSGRDGFGRIPHPIRQPEVIAFLARHMKKLNQFYLSVATNGVIDHPWSADETPLDDRLFGNYLERISDIASSDQSDSLANKLKKVDKILDRKFISDTGLPAK